MRPATKPVTFRTLDIGGDKVLPYMRAELEENPALGWRAIRLGLDRPGLLRSQIRALLRAGGGARAPKIMFPMIATCRRIRPGQGDGRARARPHCAGTATSCRSRVEVGTMVEVPSLLYQLDELLKRVDFLLGRLQRPVPVPVRGRPRQQPRVADRFDPHVGADAARAARHRRPGAKAGGKPVTLCGEMASQADRRAGADGAGLSARCR